MGTRFRKSVKIAPGVKLNVSKKSIGISAGTKGAHVSVNSSGRVTKTVGIPGSGFSHSSTSTIGKGKDGRELGADTTRTDLDASGYGDEPHQGGDLFEKVLPFVLAFLAFSLTLYILTRIFV